MPKQWAIGLAATFMWIVCAVLIVACWNAGKVFTVLLLILISIVIALMGYMEYQSHRED